MTTNGSNAPGPHGRRLLVCAVDQVARDDPSRAFAYLPRSSDPRDGWKPLTYREAANGIDYIAHELIKKHGQPATASFPTVAYIGPNDIRYIFFLLGAAKAGYKALLISPRNTNEAQLNLFEKTDCNAIWYPASLTKLIQLWLQKRSMDAVIMPELPIILDTAVSPFPYDRTFDEAEWDPLVVLHTSGTTGMPKPIISRQGQWTLADEYRDWPEFHGAKVLYASIPEGASMVFSSFPFFHAGGLMVFTGIGLLANTPCALPIPDRPLTGDIIIESLLHSGADAAALPASVLEELSTNEDAIALLKKMSWVGFGGGNLSSDAGNRLAARGVLLSNSLGSTEFGVYPFYHIKNPELWQYFLFDCERMGCEFRRLEGTEDEVYELIAVRRNIAGQSEAPVFYTFPELDEWSTRDLFKPHPTLADHWTYYGRIDNVIVFSNGEKLNPVTIEDILAAHRGLSSALVVGQGRFQAGLILEPTSAITRAEDREKLIDSVWPLVQQANDVTVAHGRIARELITVSVPDKPFPRAAKGTIQRGVATKLYEAEIDSLYDQASQTVITHGVDPLDTSSDSSLAQAIQDLFASLGSPPLEPDTDFFSAGIDSLQVANAVRRLRAGLAAAGHTPHDLSPRTIYAHPTALQLAAHLRSADAVESTDSTKASDIASMQALLRELTRNLPSPSHPNCPKPAPLSQGQTVLLTGTTGSLGSYLLETLITNPRVSQIFALNRHPDGGRAKQTSFSAERGLSTDWTKVRFLHADLSFPQLGLAAPDYDTLVRDTDRIIHNAWPVNFHYSAAVFAPHVIGVRRLVDLAAAAAKRVPIVFVSSRGAVEGWWRSREGGVPVPEEPVADLDVAMYGYGLAKAVGSLVLDAAVEVSGVEAASVRLGQIAGPRGDRGEWNRGEFLPSLIRSSLFLGKIPRSLGVMDVVDWVPVEDMAGLVLDVAGVTGDDDVSKEEAEIRGYFHGVNPAVTRWDALLPAIREFYGERIKEAVDFEDWVVALEGGVATAAEADENPAVKLLDTYKSFLGSHKSRREAVVLSTERTKQRSSTMQKLEAISPELMKHWCQQWSF